ncbi:MAG: radical SAM protein [bacterium]|nr:radical SAM protein [bacterium]
MGTCVNCKKSSSTISETLGVCLNCIKRDWKRVKPKIEEVHQNVRKSFGFDKGVVSTSLKTGRKLVKCTQCVNKCEIYAGGHGYCKIKENRNGKLVSRGYGFLDWYFDSLPTNCVADWVCPGNLAYGYKNLAVFYRACNFDCLFCQNWHFRQGLGKEIKPEQLASNIDPETYCICYFGGDPTPQIQHVVKTSELALKKGIRICLETNGSLNPKLLSKIAKISFESGGCIKFDLKAFDERLNFALCGVTNKQTFTNFANLASLTYDKPTTPFLIASTLLVPGYVDTQEVSNIAQFIASLNPDIPYSLLAFSPCFLMSDLPRTSRAHAEAALKIAKKVGLKRVHIGNMHLLSDSEYSF